MAVVAPVHPMDRPLLLVCAALVAVAVVVVAQVALHAFVDRATPQ